MPILRELKNLYRQKGHEIVAGILPNISGAPFTDFTYLVTSDNQASLELGIAPYEVYFFEHLFEAYRPKNIFIVGNSFGWSSFAIALLNRDANILAIDAGINQMSANWVDITNDISRNNGLPLSVVKGTSPQDVSRIIIEHFGSEAILDFVFIDGLHTQQQVVLDYQAVAPFARHHTVFLFHDALYWDLTPGILKIVETSALDYHSLIGTSSGMALLCRDTINPDVAAVAADFEAGPKTKPLFEALRRQSQSTTNS